MKPFLYIRPKNLKEAIDAVSFHPQASFIAGGTNLLDLMKRGLAFPEKLVDINHLPLKKIEQKRGILRIGALALNSDVARHKLVNDQHPLLVQAINEGASGQLRNMATTGGNLLQQTRCPYFYDTAFPCNRRQPGSGCSAVNGINRHHAIFGIDEGDPDQSCIAVHSSDMSVALVTLNAEIVITGQNGERRVPLAGLYRAPGTRPDLSANLDKGELITAVEIPDSRYGKNVHYLKVRDRASYAFALVSAAVALDMRENSISSASISLGGVAYMPWRLQTVEKFLIGQIANEALLMQAADMSVAGARPFEHNAYKVKLVRNVIYESLKTAAGIA